MAQPNGDPARFGDKRGAPLGNQNGRKARIWSDALKRALARASNKDVDHGLDLIADQVVKLACGGDMAAVKEIGDRMEGKVVTIIGNDDSGPLIVQVLKLSNGSGTPAPG